MAYLSLPDSDDRLYYEVRGSGPPLLLVSGLSGVATFWDAHVPALAERFTVVVHDHRGCGRSSLSLIDYSVAQMSADVLCLMDHLQIERADFIGHSTGGAIGQTLAIDRPARLRRLVLSATWSVSDAYFRLFFQSRAELLRLGGAAAYLRASALSFKPAWWVRDHADELSVSAEQAAQQIPDPRIVLRRIAAITRFDRQAELGRVRAPTLVLGARDDVVTPAYFSHDLGQRIPDAQTVVLPQGGHFYNQVYPETFRRIVLEFLERAQGVAP